LPQSPCIWAAWHEANLVTIALHHFASARPALAFVPPGYKGAAVRGWLRACRIEPVFLPADPRGAVALRHMRAALARGSDVIIALDGPVGPRRQARPGALWLADIAGVPVMPVGCAASSAWRVPRWDRHLVPLPGARIMTVFGEPLVLDDRRSPDAVAQAARVLNDLTRRAERALLAGALAPDALTRRSDSRVAAPLSSPTQK
jgi:lysophospholipid acyltransferase (LPLAT)-like uncharacterized protein